MSGLSLPALIIRGETHAPRRAGSNAYAIVLQFVAQRSALAIDTGCVQSMDPGPFVLQ